LHPTPTIVAKSKKQKKATSNKFIVRDYVVGEMSAIKEEGRKVSIIILTKDNYPFISNCIRHINKHVQYRPLEILIGDTGSSDPKVLEFYDLLDPDKVKIVRGLTYNFSAANNKLAEQATGGYLLFMNNDVYMENDCVSAAMRYIQTSAIGQVGIRLVYPKTGRIDHDGQLLYDTMSIIGPGHVHINKHAKSTPAVDGDVQGITGAWLLMRKNYFLARGGFSTQYKDIYQDCDLSMRSTAHGERNWICQTSHAIHVGSGTRKVSKKPIDGHHDLATLKSKWSTKIPTLAAPKHPRLSIVTCCNNVDLYRDMLNSLPEHATPEVELIPIFNFDNWFNIPQALNLGISMSRGDYVMLNHQDTLFAKGWYEEAMAIMDGLKNFGVLGTEGVRKYKTRVSPRSSKRLSPGHISEVDTIDELCLLIKDKTLRFDENLQFHFYGADICLKAQEAGMTNYIISPNVTHRSGGGENLRRFPKTFIQDARTFWSNWRKRRKGVVTTTTVFSPSRIQFLILPKLFPPIKV